MKRLTYRDNEGRAQWAPELLEDNTGMAGSVIRSFVADVEDILGGRSQSESVKRCSISGKAETISDSCWDKRKRAAQLYGPISTSHSHRGHPGRRVRPGSAAGAGAGGPRGTVRGDTP